MNIGIYVRSMAPKGQPRRVYRLPFCRAAEIEPAANSLFVFSGLELLLRMRIEQFTYVELARDGRRPRAVRFLKGRASAADRLMCRMLGQVLVIFMSG